MTIEKTFKLTIKDAAYFLTEQEVTALYEQCRQALNISATNPNCRIGLLIHFQTHIVEM